MPPDRGRCPPVGAGVGTRGGREQARERDGERRAHAHAPPAPVRPHRDGYECDPAGGPGTWPVSLRARLGRRASDSASAMSTMTTSRLLSLNVGMPRDVEWEGRVVHTGIWKDPVEGRRMVRRLNIDGDGQGDTAGHGGPNRAVFVYQLDSYRYWCTSSS